MSCDFQPQIFSLKTTNRTDQVSNSNPEWVLKLSNTSFLWEQNTIQIFVCMFLLLLCFVTPPQQVKYAMKGKYLQNGCTTHSPSHSDHFIHKLADADSFSPRGSDPSS